MTAELVRERVYRLGGGPVSSQYFPLPRTAIVDYHVLRRRAEAWPASKAVTEAIECFWREHGAPSVAVGHAFLEEAVRIDAGSDGTAARQELLRRWVEQCGTRSRASRALEWAELAVCVAVRRFRPGNNVPAREELAYLWHETVRVE